MTQIPSLESLLQQLRTGRIKSVQFVEAVAASSIAADIIAAQLHSAFEAKNWATVQALVLVTFRRPSSVFVPVLCAILSAASPDMTNEDVVDALREHHDLRAIPALELATDLDLEIDEFHHVNRKSVYALAAISDAKARAALQRIASGNRFAEVREAAQQQLELLGGATA
jgi:hypothetical protein